uniref:Uncharacterized protein n=1 Tax=Cannabis sativa TaxID=3483 RepID=A0A803PIJ8_CANSA
MADQEGLAGPPLAGQGIPCAGQPQAKGVSGSTCLPQDPMMADPNPNPDEQPFLPKADLPTTPQMEDLINSEQPLWSRIKISPQYYAGEIGLGIGKPAISEPHEAILWAHQAELERRNRKANNQIRWFNERIVERRHDLIIDPLQGRLINSLGRTYRQVDGVQTVQPSPSSTRTDLHLPEDGQIMPNRSYSRSSHSLAPVDIGG